VDIINSLILENKIRWVVRKTYKKINTFQDIELIVTIEILFIKGTDSDLVATVLGNKHPNNIKKKEK
jgi:hypothetical protein